MEKMEYRPLTVPELSWTKERLGAVSGELVAQPLEPGFGTTLGNALRRVLLGAIEGSAVTSVIIKGVNNEFSSLQGVVEDVMQIVLNIKQIVIANKTGKPGVMRLLVTGAATARVSDITADSHLTLINKDHVIANVSHGGGLDIEFFVESGRGYQVAQWPAGKALQEDGRIYLDAMFCPVVKVAFDVEKTRVGSEIDYDRLILKLFTNGSKDPVECVHYAVSVLRTQLENFLTSTEIPFNEISRVVVPQEQSVPSVEPEATVPKGLPVDLLFKSIAHLELSVRAHNCLLGAGLKRVIDLVNMPRERALEIKNFGNKSLKEVEDSLKLYGLHFGMNIKEDDLRKMIQEQEE